jgi:hypothetical protein
MKAEPEPVPPVEQYDRLEAAYVEMAARMAAPVAPGGVD